MKTMDDYEKKMKKIRGIALEFCSYIEKDCMDKYTCHELIFSLALALTSVIAATDVPTKALNAVQIFMRESLHEELEEQNNV